MEMIKKRLLPCVLIVVVTLGCVLLSRPSRILFFTALAIVSAFELQGVLLKADMPICKWYLSGYILLHGILCLLNVPAVYLIALFLLAAFGAMFWAILAPVQKGAKFAISMIFSLMWPFAFYAVILHACASDMWLAVLATAVLGAWACDCMALLGGMAFGKHKLAPHVSPNKTWEGTIIGGLCAFGAGFLIWLAIRSFIPIGMWTCVLTAFIASCFGQVGDLTASLFKRMAGVKDYGHLMPEHGGIMDKTDSMLFAIPAAYFCLHVAALLFSAA